MLSVAAQMDSFNGRQIEFDGKAHDLLPGLGLTGGVGIYHNGFGRGGGNTVVSRAVTIVWQPSSRSEFIPFYSRISTRDARAEPIVLLAGDEPSPPVRTTRFLGQNWARSDEDASNYGILSRVDLGPWRLRASLVRSEDYSPISYTPLYVDALPSGAAGRVVVAERGAFAGATSAEIQLSRTFGDSVRRSRVYLATWGRDQQRRYGATDVKTLSSGIVGVPDAVAQPDFAFGGQTRDRVRQITVGLAYDLAWRGVGNLNLGVQRTGYRKAVVEPGGALPASTASPWLFNVAGSVDIVRGVALYAGLSRGLEESDVAPAVAVNRNQAPPAIRTSQVDAGVRWTVTSGVSLVADLFLIEKPYFGLDAGRVFRDLGRIRHRGAELSLAGSPLKGLSIVAGSVLLDATVSGDDVDAGVVGRRPVGSTPVTLIASVDYRLPGLTALSFDANIQQQGSRTATVDDRLWLPPHTILGLGTRYRLKLAGRPAVLRVQSANVADAYSWAIAASGALQPNPPRQITGSLTLDI